MQLLTHEQIMNWITHMEMIKGIQEHGYHDELVVPIIENTAHEGELTESLSQAAECYHYLFVAAIKLHQLGLDWSTPSHSPIRNIRVVLVDETTYDTEETKDDIKLLGAQVEEDVKQGVVSSRPIPPDEAGKDEVIASLVANVNATDRKITALKQFQVGIYSSGSREAQRLILWKYSSWGLEKISLWIF
ncbi:probable bifunctional methylthioribulose-1-phosphate dehydratase/enolase-phosphatase E1 isoform X2 [Aristolochia californica]|uniref:probable bifunctional methylthioribulose-1-phosphate dehydratase/enolase-phosphatase E1 isoform X2 n=1 Tax=Aristolochia californica TaxID=171875 RepID=UPI0035D63371